MVFSPDYLEDRASGWEVVGFSPDSILRVASGWVVAGSYSDFT